MQSVQVIDIIMRFCRINKLPGKVLIRMSDIHTPKSTIHSSSESKSGGFLFISLFYS